MKDKAGVNIVREINASMILRLLSQKPRLSRYELSGLTGLSAPAVSNIADALIGSGYIRETGKGATKGGRPPLMLELDPEGGFVIGADIGSDDVVSVLADLRGNTVSTTVTQMTDDTNDLRTFALITGNISDTIKASGKAGSLIRGMGVGISGEIDSDSGTVIKASRLHWSNIPLGPVLRDSFHMPVFIEDNVRMLSYAEKMHGAGKDYDDIVCLRVGDDIGAGIMIKGLPYPGSSGSAGTDIGKMIMIVDGTERDLESLVSARAIMSRAAELSGRPDALPADVKGVAEAASAGDGICMQVMDETGKYIAAALANITACIDPELIIIGGGIANAGKVLFEPMEKYLSAYLSSYRSRPKILPALLGSEAFALGAASYVLNRIYAEPFRFKKPG